MNGTRDYNLLKDVTDGAALFYDCEANICLSDGAFEHIPGNGGKPLTFKQEPENPKDNKAVAIYLDGIKIGYIYRGTLQVMYNDYAKRGWLVSGYLNKYSADENKATYKIGFYKPLNILKSKRFSLDKINKRIDKDTTCEDNLLLCSKGDKLSIKYDDDDECFIVRNDMGREIGELPASAVKFINENGYKRIVGILDELRQDKTKITVYLVK